MTTDAQRRNGATCLLVLACSRRKRLERGLAWELYDGRVYQVLRKALVAYPDWRSLIDVRIISARYGILCDTDEIEAYEKKLTPGQFPPGSLCNDLRRSCQGRTYQSVHVNLGQVYLATLGESCLEHWGACLEQARGGIGQRNAQTRSWVLQQLAAIKSI